MHHLHPMHIGLFDSGVGGLTVLRALQKKLPHASFTYLGDTKRMPYGEKHPEDLLKLAEANLQFLLKHEIDLLVIACSTASAWTLAPLRSRHTLSIVGMIESGVLAAIQATRSQRIGVLATRATIHSKTYETLLRQQLPQVECTAIAAPLLVPLIEEGFVNHPATKLILRDYLAPFKEASIDTLLLGCTHYPLLVEWIAQELGSGVTLIDPAAACAEYCLELYPTLHAKSAHQSSAQSPVPSAQRFFVSQDTERFRVLGSTILGYNIPFVELCEI